MDEAIPLEDIEAARRRIDIVRTPLIHLPDVSDDIDLYLKLENLQPIGSFKLRGAGNAIALASEETLAEGVYTASAGNMAQGVAWNARRLGIPCTVVVPDHAPQAKTDAITALGSDIIRVPFDEWWQVMVDSEYPGLPGLFVHPVSDPAVIAGNGTIGLEIAEDLPDVDAVVVPFGGGGLSCGIASALAAVSPRTEVYAAEVETAAPFAAALAAGEPTTVEYIGSFVDGIGSTRVLPAMWPLARKLLAGSIVVSLDQVAEALRTIVRRAHVVAEGAGATSLAAALTGAAGHGKVVCVLSGGNIDAEKLARILLREM